MIWGKTKSKHNPRQSLDEKSKPKPSAFSWVPEGFYVGVVRCDLQFPIADVLLHHDLREGCFPLNYS